MGIEKHMSEAGKNTGCSAGASPDSRIDRRELIEKGISVAGWGSLFALSGVGAIETVRFFSPSVLFHPPSTYEIGTIDYF